MICTERLDGTDWYRTWSDTGKSLLQVETGIIYGEAIDHISNSFTYVEVSGADDTEEIDTNELYRILTDEEPGEDAEEIVNILLGREDENNDEGTGESISEDD